MFGDVVAPLFQSIHRVSSHLYILMVLQSTSIGLKCKVSKLHIMLIRSLYELKK